ncbi:aldehyde dehydrogenase family protein, partial [Corynebacterium pseudodiphtheriticum]|uniref:aldehyde dehydrogenase family protein n=1 Tax=Corynebacterium pseudodiphtheriticum TaxID=37637 RepID=UPI000F87C17F
NTVVLKPAEITPLTSLMFAQAATAAGIPAGVVNIVSGTGREAGEHLVAHPDVAMTSFTGSTAVGQRVAELATATVKRLHLELGGKAPFLVFDDADLDRAADTAMMANFYSSGQVCTNGTRVFVPKHLQAAFEAKIVERVARIRVGNPQDDNTNFGPLVSFGHMESVLGYIAKGKEEGARLLCGGDRLTDGEFAKGAFVAPTVFTDCTDDMTIVREEIFGPVMSILTYETEEEVIRRANDTD